MHPRRAGYNINVFFVQVRSSCLRIEGRQGSTPQVQALTIRSSAPLLMRTTICMITENHLYIATPRPRQSRGAGGIAPACCKCQPGLPTMSCYVVGAFFFASRSTRLLYSARLWLRGGSSGVCATDRRNGVKDKRAGECVSSQPYYTITLMVHLHVFDLLKRPDFPQEGEKKTKTI